MVSSGRSQGGAAVTPLTALDRIEIEQLAIRYTYGLDTTADNGYLYAGVFTPDGEFVRPAGAAHAGARGAGAGGAQRAQGQPDVRAPFHHQPRDRAVAGGATGTVYLMVVDVEESQPSSIYIGGQYKDVYVRTPAGWRNQTARRARDGAAAHPGLSDDAMLTRTTSSLIGFAAVLVRSGGAVGPAGTPRAAGLSADDQLEISSSSRATPTRSTRVPTTGSPTRTSLPPTASSSAAAAPPAAASRWPSSDGWVRGRPQAGQRRRALHHESRDHAGPGRRHGRQVHGAGQHRRERSARRQLLQRRRPLRGPVRKHAQGWRFKRRQFIPSASAPRPAGAASRGLDTAGTCGLVGDLGADAGPA